MRKSGFNVLSIIFFLLIFSPAYVHSAHFFSSDSARIEKKSVRHDLWLAPDKGLHFLGSMMVTIASAKSLEQQFNLDRSKSLKLAVSFSFCLGIGKELRDSRQKNNFFSWKDLIADGLGTILGRLILEIE